jgi:hypothetical protein
MALKCACLVFALFIFKSQGYSQLIRSIQKPLIDSVPLKNNFLYKGHASMGFQAGVSGPSLIYSKPLGKRSSFMAGVGYFPYSPLLEDVFLKLFLGNDDRISLDVDAAHIVADLRYQWRPFMKRKNWMNNWLLEMGLGYRTQSDYSFLFSSEKTFTIGSYQFTPDDVGSINIKILTQKLQPYLGIRYYPYDPRHRLQPHFSIGSYYHGRPGVEIVATGMLEDNEKLQPSLKRNLDMYRFFPSLEVGCTLFF